MRMTRRTFPTGSAATASGRHACHPDRPRLIHHPGGRNPAEAPLPASAAVLGLDAGDDRQPDLVTVTPGISAMHR